MKRRLSSPRPYLLWTGLEVAGLVSGYLIDPYLFGFAVFILGPATGLVTLVGVVIVIASPTVSPRARWTVAVSLLLGVAAVLLAFSLLGSFHWA